MSLRAYAFIWREHNYLKLMKAKLVTKFDKMCKDVVKQVIMMIAVAYICKPIRYCINCFVMKFM